MQRHPCEASPPPAAAAPGPLPGGREAPAAPPPPRSRILRPPRPPASKARRHRRRRPARRLAHAALVPESGRRATAASGYEGPGRPALPAIATAPVGRHVLVRGGPLEGERAAGCGADGEPAHTMRRARRGGERSEGPGGRAACAAALAGLSGVEPARGLNSLGVGPGGFFQALVLKSRPRNEGSQDSPPGLFRLTPVAAPASQVGKSGWRRSAQLPKS